MTDQTAREVVERLHQYDDLPPFPEINIHFFGDQPVVVDENVITSRFIYDIPQFVDAIVAQLN